MIYLTLINEKLVFRTNYIQINRLTRTYVSINKQLDRFFIHNIVMGVTKLHPETIISIKKSYLIDIIYFLQYGLTLAERVIT